MADATTPGRMHRTCCRCRRQAPTAEFSTAPSQIIAMLEETSRLHPTGYYRVRQPIQFSEAVVSRRFELGTVQHIAHLDISGQSAADDRDWCAEPICQQCQAEVQETAP